MPRRECVLPGARHLSLLGGGTPHSGGGGGGKAHPCEPVRIKGLTRESFAVNLLSLLTTDPEDSARLAEPPAAPLRARLAAWLRSGDSEARAMAIEARQLGLDPADLLDAPLEVVLLELSDLGLDDRVRIPNALKSVVFRAGEAMRHAPLTAGALRAHVDESLLRLAHGASGAIDELIGLATLPDGTVSLPLLLDGMNRSVQGLRGSLTHTARPLLNSLLADTRTGTALFGSDNALFVDEVSVCGSACVTLEVLGRAFRPRFRGSFGSIVGMWAHASFLDIAAASFFTLKPLEDVPFLSPHLFVPVEWNEVRPVRPTVSPAAGPWRDGSSGGRDGPSQRSWSVLVRPSPGPVPKRSGVPPKAGDGLDRAFALAGLPGPAPPRGLEPGPAARTGPLLPRQLRERRRGVWYAVILGWRRVSRGSSGTPAAFRNRSTERWTGSSPSSNARSGTCPTRSLPGEPPGKNAGPACAG